MNDPGGNRTALVTGASGGIGYKLAKICAENKLDLVLTARNQPKLEQLGKELSQMYGISARVLPKDLSHHSTPNEIFCELKEANIGVDVLINNAGFGTYGLFRNTDLTDELEELQVNIVALTHLTKLFLPGMLERGWGKIMNVASTAAFQPGPYMAVYAATKAYVLSFSDALGAELEGTGVTVTALCPGITRTGFQERAHMADSRLLQGIAMDAETVARAGFEGMMQGRAVVVPGFQNRLLGFLSKIGPRRLVIKGARWAQQSVSQ